MCKFNYKIVRCTECGVESPNTALHCWNCGEPFKYLMRYRVNCYYCGKAMDFIWGGRNSVKKFDLSYMMCIDCANKEYPEGWADTVAKEYAFHPEHGEIEIKNILDKEDK